MLEGHLRDVERVASGRSRSPWVAFACGIAERLQWGALTLEMPSGERRIFTGAAPGPHGHLRIVRERALGRFVTGGTLGFAEAYLDGDWESRDLARLLELLAVNEAAYAEHASGRPWSRWLARLHHAVRPNTRRGSRRNILAHYDLGNDFYAAWLDPGMTYSAARFEHPDQPLAAAQRTKLESLARRIGLGPDHHVLEVGCGWGSFAEFVAREVGARVTAITVSERQHAYAARRIQAAGLGERAEVRLQDYRDVDGRFDRIASIEMFEAVGERFWPLFFARLRECLAPGGIAGLQVITIGDRYFERYRRSVDFIQRHVFPGGMLPSPAALAREFARAGLAKVDEITFATDYARTLQAWNGRFQAAWPQIGAMGFDRRFKRLWEYYLAYCAAGFRTGCTNVAQIALRAP
jgi:cyclopropane-fatty-acyl-phospholipid synthase